MPDDIVLQVTESPIILQYTKQGIDGVAGPVGPAGADGITWEVAVTMTGSPDGTCTLQLYKNGDLCTTESHYVYVEKCPYNSSSFSYVEAFSGTITGTKTFNYTGVRMFRASVYSDADKEKTLCVNTCNFGRTATVAVGAVTNVQQGSEYVTNVGTQHDAILNFGLPKGDEPVVAVGNTTNAGFGGTPQVTGREGNHNPVDLWLDFAIPNGAGIGAWVDVEELVIEPGIYYTPAVNSTGLMSWTNNGGLDNPSSVQVTVKPRGAWSSSTTYKRLDAVTYNGSSYIATASSITAGTLPTDTSKWQMIAERGNDGQDGQDGQNGQDGAPGRDGNVMYATFDVDTTNGQLYMYTNTGYDGANFSINSSGNLLVTI